MKKEPGFVLIGTGFIMPRHVEAINAIGGKIKDVVNTAYGEYLFEDVIKHTSAENVVILAPNHFHRAMVRNALYWGKSVLCEKPLGISTKEVEDIIELEKTSKGKVFTVLQLRHHPLVKRLEREIDPEDDHEITIYINVFRDQKYYSGWKGDDRKSGGILFNLGSHYFDLLVHLFGVPEKILAVEGTEKTMEGILEGKNFLCNWRISTDATQKEQQRVFQIDGQNYNFSSKDNLSYESLHRSVYEDFIQGKGIAPSEVLPATLLIENIYGIFKNGGAH